MDTNKSVSLQASPFKGDPDSASDPEPIQESGIAGKFKNILSADGLWTAMRWLNGRVPYRFTAIFAFDGDLLRNVCLVDKENRSIMKCSDQPIAESYCMYIYRRGERFSVEAAALDGRVADHPKRRILQSYYGIPLYGAEGQMLGTVCHFNEMPVRVTEKVAAELDDLAPLITQAVFTAHSEK